eukprot:sb/3464080/
MIMVPKYNYLVYTQSRSRIVREQIGVPPPVTVLNNLGKVAALAYEPKEQIVFYLDTDRAEIGRVNLKDNEKSTLFENLENPGTVLTFDPASQSVFWVEGRGETAKLRAGRLWGEANYNGEVTEVDTRTGATRPITDGSDPVNSIAIGPTGSVYIGQTDRNVYLINPKTLAREFVMTTSQMPDRMSIEGKRSPFRKTTLEKLAPEKNPLEDGGQKKPEPKQFLLYATPNGVVREPLGRPEDAKLVSRTQPTIMLDKNTILYPRNEKQLVLENVETGTASVLISTREPVKSLAFNPEKRDVYVLTTNGNVNSISLASPSEVPLFRNLDSPDKMSFSPKQRALVWTERPNGQVVVKKGDPLTRSVEEIARQPAVRESDKNLQLLPTNGRLIFLRSGDIYRMDANGVTRPITQRGDVAAFSPDGDKITMATREGQLISMDPSNGEEKELGRMGEIPTSLFVLPPPRPEYVYLESDGNLIQVHYHDFRKQLKNTRLAKPTPSS